MADTPNMEARLVEPGAAAWAAVLSEARHDFYHLPGYVVASARNDGGDPRALIVDDGRRRLLLPLVVRPVNGGTQDACSPYGYPGPVVTGAPDLSFERAALLSGIEMLRGMGFVSLFVRTHPLLNTELPDGVGTIVQHGVTVSVDLSLTEEELWKQTRRNHRQQIRQALDKGYSTDVDDGDRYLEAFKSLYRRTMEDRGADDYYFFDDDYFDALRALPGCEVHVAAALKDDAVTAAGLFVVTEDIAQMHLTGHDRQHAADQPMKLVFHAVRSWARERGLGVLHLGGGRGGAEDSLLHFKAGFSPRRQPYHTLRAVLDEQAYVRLVTDRDPSLDPHDHTKTFPAYRDE